MRIVQFQEVFQRLRNVNRTRSVHAFTVGVAIVAVLFVSQADEVGTAVVEAATGGIAISVLSTSLKTLPLT